MITTRTINRRSHQAREILERAESIRVFTETNGFSGEPMSDQCLDPVQWHKRLNTAKLVYTTPQGYLKGLLEVFSFAKLYHDGGDSYRLRVHGNEWYEFEAEIS